MNSRSKALASSASSQTVEVLPSAKSRSVQRHNEWTAERQVSFLRALAEMHNVSAAARAVGMSRQSAYKLRARLRGEPFDLAWDAAFQSSFDKLAEVAMERALNGVEVPHYHQGELIGTSRRYDERLTIALLAMRGRRQAAPSWHPASAYRDAGLNRFIARIQRGPETWDGYDGEEEDRGDGEWDAEPDHESEEPGDDGVDGGEGSGG